jgi:ABC1 atypical kinase-like domain
MPLIAQVYKARVRGTSRLVALKVQRPEAFSSAAVDMFILRRFAGWFKQWKKLRSDLVGIADEFGAQVSTACISFVSLCDMLFVWCNVQVQAVLYHVGVCAGAAQRPRCNRRRVWRPGEQRQHCTTLEYGLLCTTLVCVWQSCAATSSVLQTLRLRTRVSSACLMCESAIHDYVQV